MEATQALCKENNIQFIPFPRFGKSEAGYLKKDYYANDATHANEDFAEALLAKWLELHEKDLGLEELDHG